MNILLSSVAAAAIALFGAGTPANVLPGGPPRAMLCGMEKGEVQRKAIMASPEVRLHGCVPDARLAAFSLSYVNAKGATVTLSAKGTKLSDEMLKAIGSLPDGATFTLTGFSVADASGKAYKLPDAVYTLRG